MKKMLFTFLCLALTTSMTYACSAIVLKNQNQAFLAKNFDWTLADGMVIKNLRGAVKSAYHTHDGQQATWTSKYGSITFNQNGKEMPYGGMNEKGLAIEMLWLDVTRYNINEEKAYLNELEWIQYQLDQFESIQQVISHLDETKIYPIKGKIHYILADHTGESVIIEYLNGKPLTYTTAPNTCQAITNNSVLQSEPFKQEANGIKKNNTIPIYRYFQLEQRIAGIDHQDEINEALAFDVLRQVRIPKGSFRTMWSIVYDIAHRHISYFTDQHKAIKHVDLTVLDFSREVGYLDINQDKPEEISNALIPLTPEINQSYVVRSLLHLGFDTLIAKDISRHQWLPTSSQAGLFAENYFHFEISIPLEKEKQTGFLAIMDSEAHFNQRQAIPGGYLYGTIGRGTLIFHIYGLHNGPYAMLAFIDSNRNRQLDFDPSGQSSEKYATFTDKAFSNLNEMSFSSISTFFSNTNGKVNIIWKG